MKATLSQLSLFGVDSSITSHIKQWPIVLLERFIEDISTIIFGLVCVFV